MRFKPLEASEVVFSFRVEEECYTPVRGQFASGDDAADKLQEDEIIDRLHCGDSYAWCCIIVEATWKGHKGGESLGCCSLAGESDVEPTIVEHGMREGALADLNARLQASLETLQERIE